MTSFVDFGLKTCLLVDSKTSNMFLGISGRNQIKVKEGLWKRKLQQENRAKVMPKEPNFSKFLKKKKNNNEG